MMWYWGGGGIHWWAWLLTAMVMVAFWALVVWGIVFAVRTISHGRHQYAPTERPDESPERLLARRFANGEIDEEEYERRLDALRRVRGG